MDFSLLAPDNAFDFSKYFQPVIDVFAMVGREVEIEKKEKKSFGKVESAFLKNNTDVYNGKMHALVFRKWKNRVKGRDWYDFEWYVRHNIPLDFKHFAERCRQFDNEEITPESFREKLKERLSSADINQVKEDVLPFLRNPKELDIWSNDYFIQLAEMLNIS